MRSSKSVDLVHAMTVDAACDYAARLVEQEQRGADLEGALARIEQRYGLSPHQIIAPSLAAGEVVRRGALCAAAHGLSRPVRAAGWKVAATDRRPESHWR